MCVCVYIYIAIYIYIYVYIIIAETVAGAGCEGTVLNRANGLCFCLPGSPVPGSLVPWFPSSLVP